MSAERSQISVVMQFAMVRATKHYDEQGWLVKDVSKLGGNHIGFDLLLTRGNDQKTVEVKGCTEMYGIPDLYGNEIDAETKKLIADELCIVYYRPLNEVPPIAIIPREGIPPEFIVPKLGYRISNRFKKAHYMDSFFIAREPNQTTDERMSTPSRGK